MKASLVIPGLPWAAWALLFFAPSLQAAGPEVAPGPSYVVAPDGDDQNDGTLLAPWKTIARAVRACQPGDVVFVRAGEYPANTRIDRSGTRERPIVLRNFPGERPVINGHGQTRYGLVLDGVRFVHVRGFAVREIRTPHPRRKDILHEQGGILLRSSSDCLIEANRIACGGLPGYTEDDPGATGIQLWSRSDGGGCHRNVIRGNDISHCAYAVHVRGPARENLFEGNHWHDNRELKDHSDGIKFESIDYDRNHPKPYVDSYLELAEPEWAVHTPRDSLIRYNIAVDNSDDGIDTWISVGNLVEYNLVSGSGAGPKKGDGNGFKLGPGGRNTVRFNLSRDNRVRAYTNNGGLKNHYENNLALGRPGIEEGVEALPDEAAWNESPLRRQIEEKIRKFHAELRMEREPAPPREVRLEGKRVSWQPPAAASGDPPACYLVYADDRLIGITRAAAFQLPPGIGQKIEVQAVDGSYSDNRSKKAGAAR